MVFWQPGQKLTNRPFQIEQILGQGGFGITYKAKHLHLNHSVVLKTPNAGLQADPDYPKFVKRFQQEGQILAKISQKSHPNIVRVSDLFYEENTPCLVMDLVLGKSLWELVQQNGALSESVAVSYIRQIGEALVIVHQEGIVHRDAHPGNIIVDKNRAVLIDFGIAGEIIPTVMSSKHPANPAFAPWEQYIQGSRDVRVDVYTLAASLYFIVTGQLPTSSLKRKLENHDLFSPEGVSDRLRTAILKGMEIDAVNRPQNMQKWLDLLISAPNIPGPGQLVTARGDLRKLDQLLSDKKWQEADQETGRVMLKIMNREKQGYLTEDNCRNFPKNELRIIDQLWLKYSNDKFGFSVQKKIWLKLGGKLDSYDFDTYVKLADEVVWRKGGNWLSYSDLTFNISAPVGHLPVGVGGVGGGGGDGGGFKRDIGVEGISFLFSRL